MFSDWSLDSHSRSIWRADPLIRWFNDALSGSEIRLLQFDALSDIPFCCSHTICQCVCVSHGSFQRRHLSARSVRPCLGRTAWFAGYAGASYVAMRYNLSLPYRNKSRLLKAKKQHSQQECAGVRRLHIDWPSKKLWAVLCDRVPPYGRQRCAEAQNWTWPRHVQANPSSKAIGHNGNQCGFV